MAPKSRLQEVLARDRSTDGAAGPPSNDTGGAELPPPDRRTNREKVAELQRQGKTPKEVVSLLGLSKARVSQLWPRTAEVQGILAEEHAAEVRDVIAQRSFADVEARPLDKDRDHEPAPPAALFEDLSDDPELASDAGGLSRQRLRRKRTAAPDAEGHEVEADPVGPLPRRTRWPAGMLQPKEPPAKSQRLLGKKSAAEHMAEGRVVGPPPDAGAVADDERDAPPPPAPVVRRRPASQRLCAAYRCKGSRAEGSACVFSTVAPGTAAAPQTSRALHPLLPGPLGWSICDRAKASRTSR